MCRELQVFVLARVNVRRCDKTFRKHSTHSACAPEAGTHRCLEGEGRGVPLRLGEERPLSLLATARYEGFLCGCSPNVPVCTGFV